MDAFSQPQYRHFGFLSFTECRLCWQITRAVFVAILVIEALMLVPSYFSYQSQLMAQYERLLSAQFNQQVLTSTLPSIIQKAVEAHNAQPDHEDTQIAWYRLLDGTKKMVIPNQSTYQFMLSIPLVDKKQSLTPTGAIKEKGLQIQAAIVCTPINQALMHYLLRILGLVLVLAGSITVVTMWIAQRRVLKPLLDINQALKNAGDHPASPQSVSLVCRDDNELGQVVLSLSRLLAKQFSLITSLQEKEQALKKANEQLQHHMDTRTEALLDANEALLLTHTKKDWLQAQAEGLAQFPEENKNPVMRVDSEGYLRFANRASRPLIMQMKAEVSAPLPRRWRVLAQHLFKLNRSRTIIVNANERYLKLQCVPIDNKQYINVYVEDITQQRNSELRAERLAYCDSLTHLPNRVQLFDELECRFGHASLGLMPRTLMLMDIDNFSSLNESYGQQVGDQLLKIVAQRLQKFLVYWEKSYPHTMGGLVARVGADEFALLWESEEYMSCIVPLMAHLAEPVNVLDMDIKLTVGLGVVVSKDHKSVEQFYQHGLLARRHAQQQGTHHYQVYTAEMGASQQRTTRLAKDLAQAIDLSLSVESECQQLSMWFQPKVIANTGAVYGSEALIRWQHPELGPLSPVEFIPIAEQNALMQTLGDWILDASLNQYRQWQRAQPDLTVAINLSSQQFHHKGLVDRIAQLLGLYQYDPSTVELELTESMLMMDSDSAIDTLHRLKALGVRLAIDDFGTGYSSFSYLSQFPVDTLKVDRSFVMNLEENASDQKITKAIIQLAHSLGMKVVAEGVETEAQLQLLNSWDCDIIQGYLFSKPLDKAHFQAYIS